MEWKLIDTGTWTCEGTDVTVHYQPEAHPMVPYSIRWRGAKHGCAFYRDEIFKRADMFIDELISAGIDA